MYRRPLAEYNHQPKSRDKTIVAGVSGSPDSDGKWQLNLDILSADAYQIPVRHTTGNMEFSPG